MFVNTENSESMVSNRSQIFESVKGSNGESMVSRELSRHIITRVTDEGLVVELFDSAGAQLFEAGGAHPSPLLEALVGVIVEVGALVSNGVSVEGHIAAAPVILKENPVWDLSTERANAMRLLLHHAGFGERRVQRMTGHADRDLAVRNPMAVRNNRL